MVSQGQRELRSKVITKRKRYSGGALVKEEEAVKEIQGNLRGNNLKWGRSGTPQWTASPGVLIVEKER